MIAMQLVQQSLVENNPLEVVELPKPKPATGQVRVRVMACGVCHTDLHLVEGDIHPKQLPIIPGHQVAGVVDAIGRGVYNLNVGNRVGVPWLYGACGTCEYCLRGEENLCAKARFTGFHVNGGFSEYMLADARYVLPMPDLFGYEHAAPLLCAGIIGYRSLRRVGLQPGERLGLVGFGASAHLAIQIAQYWGCEVYVFTRSEEHRRHAMELGAVWSGGIEDTFPKLLDRAVIFAPAGNLVPTTLERLRPGGSLVINAIYMSPIPLMEYRLIYSERILSSVANATYRDGLEFLQLAEKIPIHTSVSVYPLEDANRALLDLKYSRINGEAVLVIQS